MMVYDLCKGGTGRMILFNLSIIQFLLQVRHTGELNCNHCFCCIFSITSTKTIASSLLIFTWWSCPSATFFKSKLTTSGSWYLFSLYLICKLPKVEGKSYSLVKIIFFKTPLKKLRVLFCYLLIPREEFTTVHLTVHVHHNS